MDLHQTMEAGLPLSGMVALVTGASRGIGAAIARALAAAGAGVVVNYRSGRDQAEDVAASIRASGGEALLLGGDVAVAGDREALWGEASAWRGRVDILVNNAAIELRTAFVEVTNADWERQMAVNLTAPYFLSQAFARARIAQGGGGCIINVSSTHESRPMQRNSAYNISKAGLAMLTKSLALELAAHSIRVNGLIPGAIRTDMNREVLADPAYEAKVLEKIPLGRIASPDELAAAAVFLAGGGAGYVTGSSITVDGGLML